MESIGVVEGNLDTIVEPPNGISIGRTQPTAGADLEGLLGDKDNILLDTSYRKVYVNRDGKIRTVDLTHMEFNLLGYLMRNAGRTVPYGEIFREVLRYDRYSKDLEHGIAIIISSLRKKLGDNPSNPIYIENVRGVSYRFIVTHKHAVDGTPLGREDSIILYPLHRKVYVNQNGEPKEVRLTPTEFNLLEYLMRNAGRVVPYDEISTKVLGYDEHNKGLQNNMSEHVGNLRKKIGQEGNKYIQTVHRFGYEFIRPQNNR